MHENTFHFEIPPSSKHCFAGNKQHLMLCKNRSQVVFFLQSVFPLKYAQNLTFQL